MKAKHTPQARFIELWNAASSAGDVALAVGRPVETVRRRASNLRKRGCGLKSMRNDLDVESLSDLARHPDRYERSHEHFVLVWQRSLSIKEVMRHTGLSADMVRQKAKVMRHAGVPLKRFNIFGKGIVLYVPARKLDPSNLTPRHYGRAKA